ncbi:MAG: NUDIX domain-containing protein [Cytophagales bacterium]|jgi:8-oxo-dGTP pyrophosphatase MutT (NUDIX family)|nr:NUDIX domain-containing protein [Cytophagales bacterium]
MSLIYFKNIPMFIYDKISLENINRRANCVINYKPENLENVNIYGCVFCYLEEDGFQDFFYELWTKPLFDVYKIILLVNTKKNILDLIKQNFELIETAGGIVRKEDLILMELKKDVWDLPKGHVEPNENSEMAAKREVFEECGVEGSVLAKYLSTCHVFLSDQKIFFKNISWYLMNCVDDSKIKPQKEEGISRVEWIPITELSKKKMYSSVIYLLSTYINILPLDPIKICKNNL